MRYDNLLEPISEAEPCGPDLDEIGDDEYLNYILPAEERLPASFTAGQFFGAGSTRDVFDRSAVNVKGELKTIGELLERSRDLRLLSLDARFNILTGQFIAFAEAVDSMAALVAKFWDHIHPLGYEGDFTLRQNTMASLDDFVKVIMPMQFATIVRDKRFGPISYRMFAIANGSVQPRDGENKPDLGALERALASEDNVPALQPIYNALAGTRDTLGAIRQTFIDRAGYDSAPNFDRVIGVIGQILELVEKHVPAFAKVKPADDEFDGAALESALEEAVADGVAQPATTGQPAAASAIMAPPPPIPQIPAVPVADQREATAALQVAETYFAGNEPSSPALILARQARQLIGKPLVVALEILVPDAYERAVIRVDGPLPFRMDIGRMRALSTEEPAAPGRAVDRGSIAGKFAAATREEAAALLAGVEVYFLKSEPSSPVPVLLARARSYLNRDFLAILKDLIEDAPSQSTA